MRAKCKNEPWMRTRNTHTHTHKKRHYLCRIVFACNFFSLFKIECERTWIMIRFAHEPFFFILLRNQSGVNKLVWFIGCLLPILYGVITDSNGAPKWFSSDGWNCTRFRFFSLSIRPNWIQVCCYSVINFASRKKIK